MTSKKEEWFNVIYQRTDHNGKLRWVKIGRAFPLRTGDGFSMTLDAIPTGNWDGRLVMKRDHEWKKEKDIAPAAVYGQPSAKPPPYPDNAIPDFDDHSVSEPDFPDHFPESP